MVCLWVMSVPLAIRADVAGHPRVIDGDTLDFGGVRVRLDGMDAYERNQLCGAHRCGQMAQSALTALIGDARVRCDATGTDRYRRMLAICRVGGRDLGQAMVQAGYAVVDPRFSQRYKPDEEAAIRAGRGLWPLRPQSPAAHRQAMRR